MEQKLQMKSIISTLLSACNCWGTCLDTEIPDAINVVVACGFNSHEKNNKQVKRKIKNVKLD